MAQLHWWRPPSIVLLGIFVHAVLFASIFHVYYQSPIVSGLTRHPPATSAHNAPPARRVVIIVADGLRADTFYNNIEAVAPFLALVFTSNSSCS